MKKVIIGISVVVVLVLSFYALNCFIYNEKQADIEVHKDVLAEGVVLTINLEPLTYDGPAIVTIRLDSGVSQEIALPARGFGMCPGFKNVADVSTLRVGQKIDVRGEFSSEGIIVPCVSEDHYLRIENNN